MHDLRQDLAGRLVNPRVFCESLNASVCSVDGRRRVTGMNGIFFNIPGMFAGE